MLLAPHRDCFSAGAWAGGFLGDNRGSRSWKEVAACHSGVTVPLVLGPECPTLLFSGPGVGLQGDCPCGLMRFVCC